MSIYYVVLESEKMKSWFRVLSICRGYDKCKTPQSMCPYIECVWNHSMRQHTIPTLNNASHVSESKISSKVNGAILNNLIYTRSSLHDPFSGISSTMCLNFLLCRKPVLFPHNQTIQIWSRLPYIFSCENLKSIGPHLLGQLDIWTRPLLRGGGGTTENFSFFCCMWILVMPQTFDSWKLCLNTSRGLQMNYS